MIEKLNIDIINSLTLSELDTLRYIDNNKEKVYELSIQELAKNTLFHRYNYAVVQKIGFRGLRS